MATIALTPTQRKRKRIRQWAKAQGPDTERAVDKMLGISSPENAWGINDLNAMVLNWGGRGPAGDFTGDGSVDIDDFSFLHLNWGTAKPVTAPAPGQQPSGTVYLRDGVNTVRDKAITSNDPFGKAISGAGIATTDVTIDNVSSLSPNYALWLDGARSLTVTRSKMVTTNGGDNYVWRLSADKVRSTGNEYRNPGSGSKATLRVWRTLDGVWNGDTIIGGRLMCGGGAGNERENPQPFTGVFSRCRLDVDSIEVYPRSNAHFSECNLAGSGNIVAWDGSTVSISNCTNVPTVKWNREVNGVPTGTKVIINGVQQ